MKFKKKDLPKNKEDKIPYFHEHECDACPIQETWPELDNPHMEPTGSDKPLVYVIGEAPGESEDEQGKQMIGKTGILVRKQIPLEYKDKVRWNNSIRCRPLYPKANRDPKWEEQESCRPSIIRDIEETKPKAILAVGRIALKWAIERDKIGVWRGRKVPVRIGNHVCWLYPTYHPSFLTRKGHGSPLATPDGKVFISDIDRVFDEVDDLESPIIMPESEIFSGITTYENANSSTDIDEIWDTLLYFDEREDAVGFDIETNGLYPYADGARILSMAIGTGERTIAFPLDHSKAKWSRKQRDELWELVIQFLRDTACKKVCHNLMFELAWMSFFDDETIVRSGEWHDTMAQGYILDERAGALKLDDLIRINFGFDLKNYNNLTITNLDNENLKDVLVYNGGDTKHTHSLFYAQQPKLAEIEKEEVYQEQIRRVPTLVLTQVRGVDIDKKTVNQFNTEINAKLEMFEEGIKSLPVVQNYEKDNGELNLNSPKQVQAVLRDYIEAEEAEVSAGKYSAAKDVLEQIDHPFAKNLLEFRRYETLKTRYIKPFYDEYDDSGDLKTPAKFVFPDGKVHTNYNPCVTSTRRLSSSDPNLQNYPKRKDEWLRKYFVAPKGHAFFPVDYGQIEARVIAIASRDKWLIKSLWEEYDIHQEWADRIKKAYPQVDEQGNLRHRAKNQFVFPSFFGAIPESVAEYLGIPVPIAKKLQKEFWKQFVGVRRWQQKLINGYKENGYVESLTGFRRRAPLSVNQLINEPIQSTASDIVIDAQNRLSEYAMETEQPQFQAIMNVHDELTFCLPYSSLEDDAEYILKQMVNIPFDFAGVIPITCDAKIGENLFDLEKVGTYSSNKMEDF